MTSIKAALFDLDGVVVDTEDEYTLFWNEQGRLYRSDIPNFALGIKGYTLTQVFQEFFADTPRLHTPITQALDAHERSMKYNYIAGAPDFIKLIRASGIKTALVTSSNNKKMEAVFAIRPELKNLFDLVVTADSVKKSKPDPEGYLLAAKTLNANTNEAVVFEDSFSGLRAGKASGMPVIALSTTLTPEQVAPFCRFSISNYVNASLELLERAIQQS